MEQVEGSVAEAVEAEAKAEPMKAMTRKMIREALMVPPYDRLSEVQRGIAQKAMSELKVTEETKEEAMALFKPWVKGLPKAARAAGTNGAAGAGRVGVHTGTHKAGFGDKLHLVGYDVNAKAASGATARVDVYLSDGKRAPKLWMMRTNVSENVRGCFIMGVTGSDYIIRNVDPEMWDETPGGLKAKGLTDSAKIRRRADAVAEIEKRWAEYSKKNRISKAKGEELAKVAEGRVAPDLTFR